MSQVMGQVMGQGVMTQIPNVLTAEWLRKHPDVDGNPLCEHDVDLFAEHWPDGVDLTESRATLLRHAQRASDLGIYLTRLVELLSPATWKRYDDGTAPAWKRFHEDRDAAKKRFHEDMDAARKRCDKARAAALVDAWIYQRDGKDGE